jgi:hypothetical protein
MAFNSQGTGPKHTGQDRDDNHSTYASRGKGHMLCWCRCGSNIVID